MTSVDRCGGVCARAPRSPECGAVGIAHIASNYCPSSAQGQRDRVGITAFSSLPTVARLFRTTTRTVSVRAASNDHLLLAAANRRILRS
jgi:hypothetical protein